MRRLDRLLGDGSPVRGLLAGASNGITREKVVEAIKWVRDGKSNGVSLMVPHRSRSNRTLIVLGLALVLAATLPSCGRAADTPPASNRAAADHSRSGTRIAASSSRRRASSPGAGRSTSSSGCRAG
jgi:hypothetical protein